jgi:hypothetical protein
MISRYLDAVVTRVTDDPLFHFYLGAAVTRVTDDLIFHCYLDAVVTRVTDGLILAGGEAPITGACKCYTFFLFCYSVADPGCLSRILLLSILDPGYCFLSIPDPGSNNNNNKKGEEKITNIPNLKIILFLNR